MQATERAGLASLADTYAEILTPDAGCEYDQVIEIDLTSLEPHINGPFTPDLATPLSQFADKCGRGEGSGLAGDRGIDRGGTAHATRR